MRRQANDERLHNFEITFFTWRNTMSQPALAVETGDPFMTSDVIVEMLKQLRALDTYDTYESWSEEKIIDPLILTKERKRAIPIVGDPDETTLARVKAYYNAIASLIEKQTGLMAVPVVNITHEGFGRAFVLVGKLIAVDKTLRDVHRFGFPTLEDLCVKTEQIVDKAALLIDQYREVAEA
jgi:probable nitrogen fixation protein